MTPEHDAPDPAQEALEARVIAAAQEKADSLHHRLPQFYLRGFSGSNGRIDILTPASGSRRSAAPSKAFAEPAYYTIRGEDSERLALAEILYEEIESRAARVHHLLVEGCSPGQLSAEQRGYYANLLSAQITRGKTFRDFDRNLSDGLGKRILQLKAAHAEEWWDRFEADQEAAGEGLLDVSREQFVDFIEKDEFTIHHSPEQTIDLSLSPLLDLAELLVQFGWHTIYFEEPCLISGEEPLSYWREPGPSMIGGGIGILTSDELRFPLSPSSALILTHPRFELPHQRGRGSPRAASWLNYSTWSFRPDQPLILCPDVDCHPMPTSSLEGGLGARPFTAGPIIAQT